MRLCDLGEREIIRRFVLPAITDSSSQVIADDCAVIPLDEHRSLLLTTDAGPKQTFMELLGIGSLKDLGHYFATMSLSDIAAMGGNPLVLVAAFMLNPDLSCQSVSELVQGIAVACKEQGAEYVGGDIKEGIGLRVVTTAMGIVENVQLLKRKGANVGDILCVSGVLGKTLCGYVAAARQKNSLSPPSIPRPEARIRFGASLAQQGLATCCIDMSDGPFVSARTLGEMNDMEIELHVSALPLEAPPFSDISVPLWRNLLLSVGGDYQLMFTAHPGSAQAIQRLGGIICGKVAQSTSNPGVRLTNCSDEMIIEPWEDFLSTKRILDILEKII